MNAHERLNDMIAELVGLQGHWQTIAQAEQEAHEQQDQTREALIRSSRGKLEKDLIKTWSQIRGYKHEADISVRQIQKGGVSTDETDLGKQGDVAFQLPDGKRKVFQAKSFSGTDNSPLNGHIKKACSQLFGSNPNEIPAAGAQLIAEIDVHSGKAYWPYKNSTYLKGKLHKLSKAMIGKQAADIIERLMNEGLDVALDAIKKRAIAHGVDGKLAQDELIHRLKSSVIAVRVKYKKQLQGDVLGYQEKEVYRSTEGPVVSIAALAQIQGGHVKITKTKVK